MCVQALCKVTSEIPNVETTNATIEANISKNRYSEKLPCKDRKGKGREGGWVGRSGRKGKAVVVNTIFV